MKLKVLFFSILIICITTIMFPVSYNQTWEVEPNNSPGQATVLGSSGDFPCAFQDFDPSSFGDDYYSFSATAGQTVDVVGNANYPTDIAIVITDMSGTWLVGPADTGLAGQDEHINGYVIPMNGDYCVLAYEATETKGSGYTYSLQVTITDAAETDPPTYPGGNAGIKEVGRYFNNTANVYWYEATDASPFHYNIYVHEGAVDATTLFATAPYKQVDSPALYTNVTGINSELTYTFGVRAEDIYNNIELNTEIIISDPPTSVNDIWEIYN